MDLYYKHFGSSQVEGIQYYDVKLKESSIMTSSLRKLNGIKARLHPRFICLVLFYPDMIRLC